MLRTALLTRAKRFIRALASGHRSEKLVRLVAEEYAVATAAQGTAEASEFLTATIPPHVLRGVFQGLKYPSLDSSGSSLWPKLLGSYELELHDHLVRLLAKSPSLVVDVGAAEGYYAVGIARMLPEALVVAYEINRDAHALLRRMAVANGVDTRVEIHGRCDQQSFLSCVAQRREARTLIVCDAETAEYEIFSGGLVGEALHDADLVIELHASAQVRDPLRWMRERFSPTHIVTHVPVEPRISGTYPELLDLPTRLRRAVLFERTDFWGWVVCEPKVGDTTARQVVSSCLDSCVSV
jgi:Met-10+ like-protein